MISVATASSPECCDGGRDEGSLHVPAKFSYDDYAAKMQRRYQALVNAGIESDLAFEVASYSAMQGMS